MAQDTDEKSTDKQIDVDSPDGHLNQAANQQNTTNQPDQPNQHEKQVEQVEKVTTDKPMNEDEQSQMVVDNQARLGDADNTGNARKGSSLTSVSLVGGESNSSTVTPPSTTATYSSDYADLEAAQPTPKSTTVHKPPVHLSLRYYIMLLALVSPFILTYSRTIINFAIIDMIDPNYLSNRNSNNNNQMERHPKEPLATSDNGTMGQHDYFDLDNSCSVDGRVRSRLLSELAKDEKRATGTKGEKFQWDTDKQGYLKAAYAIGHMMFQVAGGRLSEIYGSQFIMSLSACLIAFCCLLAPFLASIHFYLLFGDLLLLGILGSFMTPSLITLISNWLTPGEKSLMMSFYLVSSRLGYALSSLLCGLLIDAQLSWRYLFYSAGWVSLVFGNLFFVCCRNKPHEHPLMSQLELDYLASKNTLVREALAKRQVDKLEQTEMKPVANGNQNKKTTTESDSSNELAKKANGNNNNNNKHGSGTKPAAPWLAIMTNLPVWVFIVTKFCVKLMGDTVQAELPVYLKRVMHMESKYNGYINSANYVIFCISCVAVGTLAKWANKRRPFNWTKTTVRKVFQCTASFGVSLVILGVSMNVCQETSTLVLFMTMFFLTTFSTGGEAQIPLDLSERYAGTIHAIGGTLAISGVIEPIFVGQFLLGHSADKDRWQKIWRGASAISFLGGLIFLTFGDARIQPFDELHSKQTPSKEDTNADTDATTTRNAKSQQETVKEAEGLTECLGTTQQSTNADDDDDKQ